MKKILGIVLILTFLGTLSVKAQFHESDERKKMWRKSLRRHKKREAYNPYLHKKKKPSEEMAKQNKRDLRKQNREARKQKRRSAKKLGYKIPKVKKA